MEKSEKFDRRGKSLNKNKLRNLPQYRDLSDEELDLVVSAKDSIPEIATNLEDRIKEKMERFSDDYDLSDMKENDKASLRALIQAIVALEDYEQISFTLRSGDVNSNNLLVIDKLSKVMEGLRKGIADFENNLAITRKHRKSDQEASVIAYIEHLKREAREFYESRMSFIFCEKCNTLLGTVWTLYPELEDNEVSLLCKQKDKNGKECGHVTVVNTKQMLENRGTNKKDVMPDALL